MNDISKMNEKLVEFAERIPAKGFHIGYLTNAKELMDLYGKALAIMEDEQTPENEEKVQKIVKEIEEIVD